MCFTIFWNKKTTFYVIKTRSSKSRKTRIFPKGLTHGFGPKMAIFPTFCFQAIQIRKMCLTIFQNKKTPFQAIKTRNSKSRKIEIFPKGLTHGFDPKHGHFSTFCFQAIQIRKMCFTIFQNKKKTFYVIKTKSSKSRKIELFPKGLTHGFGPKMAIFPTFCFQAIQATKMCFTIFQNKKTTFYVIKTRSSDSRKIKIFPKWLTHGFGLRKAIFPTFFFLGKIDQENVFYDFLEQKNDLLRHKNKKYKKSKN